MENGEAVKKEIERIDGMLPSKRLKDFQSIRFREGDVIELCGHSLEFATFNGRRELRVPRDAGAKVKKGTK